MPTAADSRSEKMKSVKPGRGPSFMGGIAGIFAALFGIIWTVSAFSMGGVLFGLFGFVFVGAAVAMSIYNFKNATSKNRYSSFDITDGAARSPIRSTSASEPAEMRRKAAAMTAQTIIKQINSARIAVRGP